jgi:hypothetical protein
VAELIKDSNLQSLRVRGSKKIIDEFLTRGKSQGEIDIAATGRDANQVYVALGLYLSRHPEYRTRVKLMGERVFLFQDPPEVQDGGSIPTE